MDYTNVSVRDLPEVGRLLVLDALIERLIYGEVGARCDDCFVDGGPPRDLVLMRWQGGFDGLSGALLLFTQEEYGTHGVDFEDEVSRLHEVPIHRDAESDRDYAARVAGQWIDSGSRLTLGDAISGLGPFLPFSDMLAAGNFHQAAFMYRNFGPFAPK